MATIQTSIENFLTSITEAIVKDQADKGIVSSGSSARSLRIEASPEGGKIYGSNYFKYQETGRGPGLAPPILAIEDWIRSKGIRPEKGDVRSFAFAIAKKIEKEGTDIFKGKRPGLTPIEEFVNQNKDSLSKELLRETRDLITDSVREAIK